MHSNLRANQLKILHIEVSKMLLYINHMITTNQNFIIDMHVCTHTERNPNVSLKTVITSQGKRAK